MIENLSKKIQLFYTENIIQYLSTLQSSPIKIILLIIDISIVLFLGYKMVKLLKNTRAWQLVKGILVLIAITILSGVFGLKILNFILTSLMTYGVIILIVIFQPELRRALEQLGTGKLSKFFGFDKDIQTKTKEDIYKVAIACTEMSKNRIGALIVFERDIKIQDITNTGIMMNSEISPQLLVNTFVPNTPLHDGAVIISDNKIAAAACMLPLSDDPNIAKNLGTRHRAAMGISKESDAIAVVVSEETGRMSIAKDGTLIMDLNEEGLKKILIKYVITNRLDPQKRKDTIKKFKEFKDKISQKEDRVKK